MPRAVLVLLLVAVVSAAAPAVHAQTVSGAAVYDKYCAQCHNQVTARIPARDALEKMSSARIMRTLDFGLMMSIAYPLKRDERQAVASFLGKADADARPPASAFCSSNTTPMSGTSAGNWPGWSPTSDNARFQKTAGLSAADVPSLRLKWAFGFPDDVTAFGAPAVVNGTVFVGSAAGTIHALDLQTGCIHWMFQADGPVRSTTVAVRKGTGDSLVFGDQIGWVYSLDAKSGRLNWKKRIEAHEATRLTGSPAVHDGVVFVPAAS